MFQLIEGGGASGAIADEVGSTEELLLAAFLHDIGKARGGNHAVVGAELATSFLRRVGFGPATVGVVADAVRLHLLLSETAVRRDIADLAVIDDVAAQVGDLRRLNVLYLLTIADLRATGTTMWNEWRAILLRKLYERVHEAIETGTAPPATRDIDTILAIAPSGVSRRAIEEHVDAMPEDYLDTAVPAEILWHLDVAAGLEGPAVISVDPLDPTRVLVAGADRMGFLLAVSRAFAANGVEILDARLRTRSDGIALDTFHVGDDQTGAAINEARWEEVAQDLSASLTGNKDLRQRIRERVKAYQPAATGPDAARLRTRRAGRFTAIEIKMPDRVGLLTHIVEALHGEGLDIHLAKIDTIGGEARDTFHVRQIGGAPVRSGDEGREVDLINLYHPLLADSEGQVPPVSHPLVENCLPKNSPYQTVNES